MEQMTHPAWRAWGWVVLAVFLAGAIVGFLGEGGSLESASTVTRRDVLNEWARVLRAMRPLLNEEMLGAFRLPPYTDFTAPADELSVAVLGAGLMQGFSDGRFLPDQTVSKGEGILAAARLEEFIRGCLRKPPDRRDQPPEYGDIPDGHWLKDALSRLNGVGCLTAFSGTRLYPDRPLTGGELRSIGSDIIGYFGQDVALLESSPEGIRITLKAAIGELSRRDLRYCWAGGIWRQVPETLVIPWTERRSGGRLHLAAAEWSVPQVEVSPAKGRVWFLAIRRDPVAAIRHRREAPSPEASENKRPSGDAPDAVRSRLDAHLEALCAKMRRNHTPSAPSEGLASKSAAVRAPDLLPETVSRKSAEAERSPALPVTPAVVSGPEPVGEGLTAVVGCVLDSLTRRPIGGATVLIGNRDYSSAKDGTFRFVMPDDSLTEVTAYAEGYEALTLKHRAGFRDAPLVLQLKPVQIVFEGVVVDAETAQPIEAARVRIDGRTVISAADGSFRLPRVSATYHQLACSASGYMDSIEIAYAEPSGKPYQVALKPLPSEEGAGEEASPDDEPYPEFPTD
ncbi:MAG TPA: S-layer homology domain-containing protein [Candidatus Ozemobacteraceae bacterium]|nr:S-layer homology domain-containing protein [Candidatus Ozemobacteraceae bacterium]